MRFNFYVISLTMYRVGAKTETNQEKGENSKLEVKLRSQVLGHFTKLEVYEGKN